MARLSAIYNRPGLRIPLAAVGSIVASGRSRRPCLVTPAGGRWLHRYTTGALISDAVWRSHTPEQLDSVIRDIFCYRYTPRHGDIVVDVGAGAGEETLTFASLVGSPGHVFALEAQPQTFEQLSAMIKANRLQNVTAVQVAVGKESGCIQIETDATIASRTGVANGVSVRLTTLDEFAQEHELPRIDLLKMNIEGAEREALQGAETVAKLTRNFVISCHDFLATSHDDAVRTKEFVRSWLRVHDCDIFERPDDPRPWVRDYLYAFREPESR